ncbi:hypothetical protein K7432_010675 [Basidiobolus ranarum]|uniref:Chitin-binding type-4 domain-containing protein n=1 Tax=Basidiobolus ranarum TaxID=34480 RepID=A0ABR2WNH1_9FUNG
MKYCLATNIALTLFCLKATFGHMEMVYPYPRDSIFSPYYRQHSPDWDVASPIEGDRSYPCQGKSRGPIQATFRPGSSIPVRIVGPNNHEGGHCQFAVSYDGVNFVVIREVLHTCLTESGTNFNIRLPRNIGNGVVVFAWSWINAQGRREYYMNCADIGITGGKAGGRVTGPRLLVANIPGHPVVEEFYYDWNDDGQSLFDEREIISIKRW